MQNGIQGCTEARSVRIRETRAIGTGSSARLTMADLACTATLSSTSSAPMPFSLRPSRRTSRNTSWQQILGETSSVQSAAFPKPFRRDRRKPNPQVQYMRGVVDNLSAVLRQLCRRRKGGKGKDQAATFQSVVAEECALIFVATAFPDWQMKCVDFVRQAWNPETGANR